MNDIMIFQTQFGALFVAELVDDVTSHHRFDRLMQIKEVPIHDKASGQLVGFQPRLTDYFYKPTSLAIRKDDVFAMDHAPDQLRNEYIKLVTKIDLSVTNISQLKKN